MAAFCYNTARRLFLMWFHKQTETNATDGSLLFSFSDRYHPVQARQELLRNVPFYHSYILPFLLLLPRAYGLLRAVLE